MEAKLLDTYNQIVFVRLSRQCYDTIICRQGKIITDPESLDEQIIRVIKMVDGEEQ